MRIAVVAPYPPRRCGIGAYAQAQVQRLRAEGHDVTVISPPDGDGDVKVAFANGQEFREAELRGSSFDRIIVHFQPGLHYTPGASHALSKIHTSLRLWTLVRRRPQVEIMVHEAHPPTRWRPDHLILRRAFARARLVFHTEAERRAFERDYRIRTRSAVVDHRLGIAVRAPSSKVEARALLGLDPLEPVLLCAGFIHRWKGFDRAIRAFASSSGPGVLAIVGSVRDATPANRAYADDLRRLAARTDRVRLIEGYQTDAQFDAWIVAADRLVFPYTRAWSSGALARAQVLGTPAIVSDVGGLAEQAGSNDVVVRSDDELRLAFERFRRERATERPDAGSPPSAEQSRPS
jgi:glycosyltransferase involved in cell wall biosynthesis